MKITKILSVAMIFFFVACQKSDDLNPETSKASVEVELEGANFEITQAGISEKDGGYIFSFQGKKGEVLLIKTNELSLSGTDDGAKAKKANPGSAIFQDANGEIQTISSFSIDAEETTGSKSIDGNKSMNGTFSVSFKGAKSQNPRRLSGRFFIPFRDIEILFLPKSINSTSVFEGAPDPESSAVEHFFYDNKARLSRYTNENLFGKIDENVTYDANGKIMKIEDTEIQNTSVPSFDEKGMVSSIEVFDGNGEIVQSSILVHNAISGALENQKVFREGVIIAEIVSESDARNNTSKSFEYQFEGGNRTLSNSSENTYEERKNWSVDLGKTTPNKNLLSYMDWFGPDNLTENNTTFFNPDGNPDFTLAQFNTNEYNYFGYPIKTISRFSNEDGTVSEDSFSTDIISYQIVLRIK